MSWRRETLSRRILQRPNARDRRRKATPSSLLRPHATLSVILSWSVPALLVPRTYRFARQADERFRAQAGTIVPVIGRACIAVR